MVVILRDIATHRWHVFVPRLNSPTHIACRQPLEWDALKYYTGEQEPVCEQCWPSLMVQLLAGQPPRRVQWGHENP